MKFFANIEVTILSYSLLNSVTPSYHPCHSDQSRLSKWPSAKEAKRVMQAKPATPPSLGSPVHEGAKLRPANHIHITANGTAASFHGAPCLYYAQVFPLSP